MIPFPGLGPAVVRHESGAKEVVLVRMVVGTQDGFTVGAIAALDGIWVEIDVREGGRVHVKESAAAWRKLGKPIPSTEKDPWAPERLLIPEFAGLVGVMADLGMGFATAGELSSLRPVSAAVAGSGPETENARGRGVRPAARRAIPEEAGSRRRVSA